LLLELILLNSLFYVFANVRKCTKHEEAIAYDKYIESELEKEQEAKENPRGTPPCPICGKFASGSCRCSGPHSIEDLKKGHGLQCPNGHNFTSEGLAYNPKTKEIVDASKK